MYTIGDFLIKVKNAYMAGHRQVEYPYSKAVLSIGKILEKEGYVKEVKNQKSKENNGRDEILIQLLYKNRMPAIAEIKLVSGPAIHRYVNKSGLSKTAARHGIGILSTSKGMMTNKQAEKEGVGGEIICQIY
jgi:small subunit ribosomal protein S8